MKVRYGTNPRTPNDSIPVFLLGCVLYSIFFYEGEIRTLLGECQESIVHSHGLNIKKFSPLLYCEFPEEYCLCSVSLNTSNTSGKCVINVELSISRILPLISYFLHIIIIRKLFSLHGNHRRFIINTLWVISILIFIGTAIVFYWSTCSRTYLIFIQSITAGILACLGLHNILSNLDNFGSNSNYDRTAIDYPSERINRQRIFWNDLI